MKHHKKQYPCGCSASGPGNLPDYCPEHGTPPTVPEDQPGQDDSSTGVMDDGTYTNPDGQEVEADVTADEEK